MRNLENPAILQGIISLRMYAVKNQMLEEDDEYPKFGK